MLKIKHIVLGLLMVAAVTSCKKEIESDNCKCGGIVSVIWTELDTTNTFQANYVMENICTKTLDTLKVDKDYKVGDRVCLFNIW